MAPRRLPLPKLRCSFYGVLVTKRRVEIELDERLLARLDRLASELGVSRDDVLARASERHLEAERRRELFAQEDAVLREAADRFPDDKEAGLDWVGRRRKELGLDQAW